MARYPAALRSWYETQTGEESWDGVIHMSNENRETPKESGETASQTGSAQDASQAAGAYRTPQGTMGLVLVYLAAMAILWFYVYFILLRSEGV